METLIETNKLSKRYAGNQHYSLHNLSLHVSAGEVYGFLGPNGAGKSTTIRLLMNFLQPTNGGATILDKDIVHNSVAIKRSVGYLASDMAMYPKMTGYQFLNYMADLQGVRGTKAYQKELITKLKAEPNKKLGNLSRGNRQKFAIIQAFMHKPQVLILDEPSSGLDPLMQEVFYSLINEAKSGGAAVFMSSHILSEVQKVCDRVGIIRDGILIAERNIAEMNAEAAHTFEITFKNTPPVAELKKIKGVAIQTSNERTVTVRVRGELTPLLATISKHEVVHLSSRQLDLEELFMQYYKDRGDK